ncbi:MAG: MerR family transcriptional regulator [Oscillospiraceae bacterium]|nr:MerR family transcriptional regulator [Oscillospiraceae bacterium]
MKINQVEELVGITKKNIRFYEQEGLLHPNRNAQNGYREYSLQDVAILQQIKLLRKLAVPLDEIRKMQSSTLTVADGMQRHILYLERQRQNLEHATQMCKQLALCRENLQDLDAPRFLEEVEKMEQKGVSFMQVEKKDIRKKYVAPIIIAVVMVGLLITALIFFVTQLQIEHAPLAVIIIFVVVLSSVALGIILALLQRIKEIKGGEEDAAGKY